MSSASAAPTPASAGPRPSGLALLALLPFLNALPYDFTYDDKLIIRDDERIATPAHVGEIFTTQYFGGELTSAQNYRPVLLLTYAVQEWIHGNRRGCSSSHLICNRRRLVVVVAVGKWESRRDFQAREASVFSTAFCRPLCAWLDSSFSCAFGLNLRFAKR